MDGWTSVCETVVADYDCISLPPPDWEAPVIRELHPLLPLFPGNFGIVTVSHLDWAVRWLEILNAWPGVEPGEVVRNVCVGDVTVHVG